jgi:IclR family transcriptional regulator, acetate operon repressor
VAETLIQSVQRAMRVVEAVAARDAPVSAKYVQRVTGLERSTCYHILRTLSHDGYVVRHDDGSYAIGPRLLSVTSRRDSVALSVRARPTLESLSAATGCTAYLAISRDDQFQLVDLVEHPDAGHVELWVSLEDAAHATALGKALLAIMNDADRSDYMVSHPLASLTERTITDPRVLQMFLVGDDGVAIDDGEYLDDVRCMAMATRIDGLSVAVGLSGPANSLRSARPALRQGVTHLAIA